MYNKKILITGINSFVGKYLEIELLKNKHEYIGIDVNGIFNSKSKKKVDIRSKLLSKYINKNTTIIHLAALSTDSICSKNPEEAFDVNINGTINLVNIANQNKAKKIIFASTEWVYGNNTKKKSQIESQKISLSKLDSLYALTKAIGEKIVSNKKNLFKNVILRFGIVYGERKRNFSAVESISQNCYKNKNIFVGAKKTSRRYIHVKDIVQSIISSLNYNQNNIFNVSGENDVTLEDLILLNEKILKKKLKIKEKNKNNITIRRPSNKKIKTLMRWKPKIDMLSGLIGLRNYYTKNVS